MLSSHWHGCTPEPKRQPWNSRATNVPETQRSSNVCFAGRRESASERALGRFLKNRLKELGTLLPPNPEAPAPDTALLWSYISRQLSEGINNEPKFIGKRLRPSNDEGAKEAGSGDRQTDAADSRASSRGVVIARPEPLLEAARTVSLPPALLPLLLPAATAAPARTSTSPDTTSGLSGGSPPHGDDDQTGIVHVYWDIQSAHPGDRDPRVVAAEVLRLARSLGRPATCSAYATRQAWAWVPSKFVLSYGNSEGDAATEPASSGSSSSSSKSDGHSGDSDAEEGSNTGVDGVSGSGRPEGSVGALAASAPSRVRCPMCGKQVARTKLEGHLMELHPGMSAANPAAQAMEADTTTGPKTSTRPATGAAWRAKAAAAPAPAGASVAPRNTYRTGLGAIREYYSSSGVMFRPPAGHQLGLKYVIQREGFEPRVVQNADGASDRAVNGGVDRLLSALRLGRARVSREAELLATVGGGSGGWQGGGAAEVGPCTLVLVSGSDRHAAALRSCKQLGLATVLVADGQAASVAQVAEADVLLDWSLLAEGAYRLPVPPAPAAP